MPPGYEPPRRRFGLAEAAALLAVIVAIVAVALAIDARNAGSDDEEVSRQVLGSDVATLEAKSKR